MTFFNRVRDALSAHNVQDEDLHAIALREFEAGSRRDGLWAKALIAADGSQRDPRTVYLQLRVQSLREERSMAASNARLLAIAASDDLSRQRHAEMEAKQSLDAERARIEELVRNEEHLSRMRNAPEPSAWMKILPIAAFVGFLLWYWIAKN